MSKQTFFLVSMAVVLAILYVAYFTDWTKPKNIHVFWRISPANASGVAFYLDKEYPLTSIKVVSTDDAKTNKYPHELWHMVAQGTPPMTKTFNYGGVIPGMKPEVPTAVPEPLQPDTDYSLIVEAGNGFKGEKSFSIH